MPTITRLLTIALIGTALISTALASTRANSALVAVVLSAQPGTDADRAARTLASEDIQSADRHGEVPLVLVGSAELAAGRPHPGHAPPLCAPPLFVQLQSASLCGSAGCSTSVFLCEGEHWRRVLDSVSGTIRVMQQKHRGMHDLVAGSDDRWTWDGKQYQDTTAAPPIAALKRSIERHQAGRAPPQ